MINGKNDMFRVVRHEMSLKHKMGNYKGFEEEESLLQAMGRKLGVSIDQHQSVTVNWPGKKGLSILGAAVQKIHIARSL